MKIPGHFSVQLNRLGFASEAQLEQGEGKLGRLTKAEIESKLLAGDKLTWKDSAKKSQTMVLGEPSERRLFAYLLSSDVRSPTQLPTSFVADLINTFEATDDPATCAPTHTSNSSAGPWRLHSIETEGFGGLNVWGGPTFKFCFNCDSMLFDGPNGSGKSSLVGAILWALSNDRPREQAQAPADHRQPVFGTDDKQIGDWPPIACYPPTKADLVNTPDVRVKLVFRDKAGAEATAERVLSGGITVYQESPHIAIPPILLEAGLLMPARLSALRFDGGKSRLTDAVQKLTGLDDLIAIGSLVDGLCHKGREFQSHKRKDFDAEKLKFDNAIQQARKDLAKTGTAVPEFLPENTDDKGGALAKFGKEVKDKAAKLTEVISGDLTEGLDLSSSAVQHQIIGAIEAAKAEVELGLPGLPEWKSLKAIADALDTLAQASLEEAIATARQKLLEARALAKRGEDDNRFQLKAVAAKWCKEHDLQSASKCPLCTSGLGDDHPLWADLEELRAAGEAAARTFEDNVSRINADLTQAIPIALRAYNTDVFSLEPCKSLASAIRSAFIYKPQFAQSLSKFCALVETALQKICGVVLAVVAAPEDPIENNIAVAERLLALAAWVNTNGDVWQEWWNELAHEVAPTATEEGINAVDLFAPSDAPLARESLDAHLERLSDAVSKAEPYRDAAISLTQAWKAGVTASNFQKEIKKREAIGERLAGLKALVPLSESVARDAIEGLSGRMGDLLERTLITESLKYKEARLRKKEGLVIHGGLATDFHIDATLVANTSWLRAVLWAFLFSLRAEAIEQMGIDSFPILIFDDPQLTFDVTHRHRWAQVVAAQQADPSSNQLLMTSHDNAFIDLARNVGGIRGRQILIGAAGPDLGHIGLFEGDELTRTWTSAKKINTPKAAQGYIADVRQYVEGLLRLMLRDEAHNAMAVFVGPVLGDCRAKLALLIANALAPWDRPDFQKLVNALDKNKPAIKSMELAHHSGATALSMAEASDVEEHWRKNIRPNLENGFRLAREFYSLHGRSTVLAAAPPTALLPNGYPAAVRRMPLQILGKAAALSDGKAADGMLAFDEFEAADHRKITLAQHSAFRIAAPTLEPVARVGDILLVKDPGEPTARSLVVALLGDRVLARRYEVADNHSDIAVLTAQSICPRQIAAPVIAQKATLTLHKIVGVIYSQITAGTPPAGQEIVPCEGESELNSAIGGTLGLVQVAGHSAEPLALDEQFLIIRDELRDFSFLSTLDGRPVVAEDSNGEHYFKRLRLAGGQVVLESMDSGGDFEALLLAMPGSQGKSLSRIWPVTGVLFELPA
tara:strand:- start:323 stop:4255 length:3933 start_codon:yes stop_codon:yes gene_type:complete